MNVQEIIEKIKKEEVIDEPTVKKLCRKVQEVLMGESNVELIQSPITLVGDVHGQFYDVQKIFKIAGELPDTKYIFIGDFVDRGYNSVETIMLLFCLKVQYPKHIYLLRGNH